MPNVVEKRLPTRRVQIGAAALQWLIQVDPKTCDLNALRLEMIDKILELRE